jgi:hypothetical protein
MPNSILVIIIVLFVRHIAVGVAPQKNSKISSSFKAYIITTERDYIVVPLSFVCFSVQKYVKINMKKSLQKHSYILCKLF